MPRRRDDAANSRFTDPTASRASSVLEGFQRASIDSPIDEEMIRRNIKPYKKFGFEQNLQKLDRMSDEKLYDEAADAVIAKFLKQRGKDLPPDKGPKPKPKPPKPGPRPSPRPKPDPKPRPKPPAPKPDPKPRPKPTPKPKPPKPRPVPPRNPPRVPRKPLPRDPIPNPPPPKKKPPKIPGLGGTGKRPT